MQLSTSVGGQKAYKQADGGGYSAPLGPEKFDQNFLGKHWGGGPSKTVEGVLQKAHHPV